MSLRSQLALPLVLMSLLGLEPLCLFLSLSPSQPSMLPNSFPLHHTLVPRMNRLILQVGLLS